MKDIYKSINAMPLWGVRGQLRLVKRFFKGKYGYVG